MLLVGLSNVIFGINKCFTFLFVFSEHLVKNVLPSVMNICWSTQTKTQLEIKHKFEQPSLKTNLFLHFSKDDWNANYFAQLLKFLMKSSTEKKFKNSEFQLHQLPFSRKRNFFEFFPISKTFIIKKLLLKKIDEQSKFKKKKEFSKYLIFHFSYSTFSFVVKPCFF